jgi:hypothetical protein
VLSVRSSLAIVDCRNLSVRVSGKDYVKFLTFQVRVMDSRLTVLRHAGKLPPTPQQEMRLLTPSQMRSTGWACIVIAVLGIATVVVEFLRAGTVPWYFVVITLFVLYLGCSALSRTRNRPRKPTSN